MTESKSRTQLFLEALGIDSDAAKQIVQESKQDFLASVGMGEKEFDALSAADRLKVVETEVGKLKQRWRNEMN